MTIQIKEVDNSMERSILIGLIMSDSFIERFIPIYTDKDYFEITWSKTISSWCISYFEKYKKAPQQEIKKIFESHTGRNSQIDEDTSDAISMFLYSLSAEWERASKFNADYLLDRTVAHFKKRAVTLLNQDVEYLLESGDFEEAEKRVTDYHKVELVENNVYEPFSDIDGIKSVFSEEKQQSLFTYPGKLGLLLNGLFRRDQFIALMGPEKMGKSWWMYEFLLRAAIQKCNVALFDAGDMTKGDHYERLVSYSSRKPMDHLSNGVMYPVFDCVHNQDNSCKLSYRTCKSGIMLENGVMRYEDASPEYRACSYCRKENPKQFQCASWVENRKISKVCCKEAEEALAAMQKRLGQTRFKLAIYPNSTLTVSEVERRLTEWERSDGFVPDVIGIDYADIMASESTAEFRHQEDHKWKNLRRLSQERHCLLITATQASAQSYKKDAKIITREHFSEDKRKMAHVTGMIGLNQTNDEKLLGQQRLNVFLCRRGRFNTHVVATVLQCLDIGRPYLGSF